MSDIRSRRRVSVVLLPDLPDQADPGPPGTSGSSLRKIGFAPGSAKVTALEADAGVPRREVPGASASTAVGDHSNSVNWKGGSVVELSSRR
ncbi:hypothetical protein ACQ9NK_31150 [Streptomyces lividans]